MSNIGIGKIYQSINFCRDKNKRSNTNGNLDTYLLFKMMIEKNPQNTYYLLGSSDYSELDVKYDNVVDVYDLSKNYDYDLSRTLYDNRIDLDYNLFVMGLVGYKPEESNGLQMLDYINANSIPWFVLSQDPRCIDSPQAKFNNLPRQIFTTCPMDEKYSWADGDCATNQLVTKYMPLHHSILYGQDIKSYSLESKDVAFDIICNETKDFDRLKVINEVVGKDFNYNIYGRWSGEDTRFAGELEYDKLMKHFKKVQATFLIPIKPGWVTTKYLEMLAIGVVPILYYMYDFYDVELKMPKVWNKSGFDKFLKFITCSYSSNEYMLETLKERHLTDDVLNCITLNDMLKEVEKFV